MSRRILLATSLLSALTLNAASAPTLAVDANAARHPIGPYIYGINEWTDSGLSAIMRVGVRRWGGNNATSYNWQIDVKNNDNDWYFTNYVVGDGVTSSFDLFHERNLQTGTLSLGTVPVMDWTPKLIPGRPLVFGVPLSCSYSVAKYGRQQNWDPYLSDCGNGVLTSTGQRIVNDPNDDYKPIDPSFFGQWVQYIGNKYGAANLGGVQMWSLDNEPEWWDSTHPDIYPNAATYDDMMARNIATAKAVKAADPSALVSGPVQGGWWGMIFSKLDLDSGWGHDGHYWSNPVDQRAHGGVPWIEYYLQHMKAAEAQNNGQRLLDALDVHAYISPGNLSNSPGDQAMETMRMTSTRALWDPNYIVGGFGSRPDLGFFDNTGAVVAPALVPRMRQWVQNNYPGTMTAITEYNWGAMRSITGGIAQADILGIFGREGLDIGTIWPPGPPDDLAVGTPGAFAFQIFLNYDGAGNQFGETSISGTTSDPDTLSIFAAQRSDTALTILVLNKTYGDVADNVSLANFAPAGTAQ
ncbi:MAG: glycoside hydrolase family 44 protein, partial [Bryobacteraceae bacterium]